MKRTSWRVDFAPKTIYNFKVAEARILAQMLHLKQSRCSRNEEGPNDIRLTEKESNHTGLMA